MNQFHVDGIPSLKEAFLKEIKKLGTLGISNYNGDDDDKYILYTKVIPNGLCISPTANPNDYTYQGGGRNLLPKYTLPQDWDKALQAFKEYYNLGKPVDEKQEWLIEKFQDKYGHIVFQYYKDNNKYGKTVGTNTLESMLHIGQCVDTGDWIIQTVSRNKMILTIGDRFLHNKDTKVPIQIVEGFKVNEYNHLLVITKQYKKGINISKCHKVDKPLFTTKDSIDIYNGDTPLYYWSEVWDEYIAIEKNCIANTVPYTRYPISVWHVYSTLEAAEAGKKKYWDSKKQQRILTEKLLSVEDVWNEWGKDLTWTKEKLTELAEKNLNS